MCFKPMKIKASSPFAPQEQFVPCGNCKECRDSQKASWGFRLMSEIESIRDFKHEFVDEKTGEVLQSIPVKWCVGFVTLTYGTPKGGYPRDMVPTIPVECFTDSSKYKEYSCFDREHVKEFFLNIRKWLHNTYGISKDLAIKYLCAGEFGELKKRPHYHAIIIFPLWNGLTPEIMFNKLKEKWSSKHGYLFPKSFYGGVNNGLREKPFLVDDDGLKAARYASKYCCKEIRFDGYLKGAPIDRKSKLWKRYNCFHVQSRSLGLSCIKNLSNSQLLDLMIKGKSFAGQKNLRPLPMYLRNKIIFDNVYIFEKAKIPNKFVSVGVDGKERIEIVFEDGLKRLCRKRSSDFLRKYAKEIYEKKVAFYDSMFNQMSENSFWLSRQCSAEYAKRASTVVKMHLQAFGSRPLADFYVSYYGRTHDLCFDLPGHIAWLSRYDLQSNSVSHSGGLLDHSYLRTMESACSMVLSTLRYIDVQSTSEDIAIQKTNEVAKDVNL